MKLRGVEFGSIFCAPGALGFFGEGYPWHRLWKLFGMDWSGTSFVAKTTTMSARLGNMPLRKDGITPKEVSPRCIIVKPCSGHVLNAVGLAGPGAKVLFDCGGWQQRTDAFMLSFMSVANSPEERLAETKQFVGLVACHLPTFKGRVALQANRACPNTGHPPDEFYAETAEMLDILSVLDIPIMVNYNPTVPGDVMVATAEHQACDGLWIANTIPWGDLRINWEAIFGTTTSPLHKRNLPISGGGGLSGPACLAHTVERVLEARRLGITKPVVAGNGIQRASGVDLLRNAGADAVAIGCVGMVRPWRMKSIINRANSYGRK